MFTVCPGHDSCTKETTYGTGPWLGSGQNFTVVDTPGFGDSDNEDEALIEEMMNILANVVDHADTILLLFNGELPRFDASLQSMLKTMTQIFGVDWWNYVVIGVSFWAYDQDSIDDRVCDPEYPDYCKDEAWFCNDMNTQLRDKLHVDKNFTCVFTDSWSQTGGNVEDPLQQEHWRNETGILWDITTSREDTFGFMTIDDILEENARLKEENKWLNDVIRNNITQLTEMIQSNSENIQDNANNLEIVDGQVNMNIGQIEITNRRIDENKAYIEQNTEDIGENTDIINKLRLAPIGTISAWVTKPSLETSDDEKVYLPEGWVRCDGATIPKPSIWAGQLTPDLNGGKKFLRGSSDSEMLTMEDEKTKLPDHTHTDTSSATATASATASASANATATASPHSHSYQDTYLGNEHGCDMASGSHWCTKTIDRTTVKETVTVTVDTVMVDVTVDTVTVDVDIDVDIGGVENFDSFDDETRPTNMHVIYIMRVF